MTKKKANINTVNTVSMNRSIVSVFEKKIKTYLEKENISLYSKKTMILDLIYFLGISIDQEQYNGHAGFEKFKNLLKEKFL